MAWIQVKKRADGIFSYFIRDFRNGRNVSIAVPDGMDRAFAERMKESYEYKLKEEARDGLG